MTLKRISDEEIRFNSRTYSDHTHDQWHYTPKAIAQAQLEADKKAHNAVIREIFEAGDTYCLDGIKHGRDINYGNVKKRECRKCWQALKEGKDVV